MKTFNKQSKVNDDMATYKGRSWESLTDEELRNISSRGLYCDIGSLSYQLHTKANEVLYERYEAKETALSELGKKKMANDGTVRALIANGEYYDVGEGVLIQKQFDGEISWTIVGGGYNSKPETVTEKIDSKYGSFKSAEEFATEVVTLCRRKFKKSDIILCSVDSFYSMERGIVFLENEICTFFDRKLEYIITYDEMEEIDFEDDCLIIKVTDGDEVSILCNDDEPYSQNLFNLLMDIKENL